VLACSSCHQAHHAGALKITGTADQLEVRRHGAQRAAAADDAHVGASANANSRSHVGASGKAGAHVGAPVNANAGTHVGAPGKVGAHVGAPANANAGTHVGAAGKVGAHVGAPTKFDVAIIRTQSKDALIGLGWKPAIAHAAVAAASAALGADATLERLIFEALRRCPQPTI
jgi:Holliday junction resolvase RuvA-like protein